VSGEFRFPTGDIEFFPDGPGAASKLGGDTGEDIPAATQAALDQKADLIGGKVDPTQLPSIALPDFLGAVALGELTMRH
jgi:hypothetical protein